MKKRALISVSDKTGAVEFARRLVALGYEILSTGGTAAVLTQNGVPVLGVSEVTGYPECLDGRLKTLHPAIHGGILAMRDNPDHMAQIELLDIAPIDIVAINLYPFKQTILKEGVQLDEAIENIDIGGPTLIRSAAKNWKDVIVLIDPSDYEAVLQTLESGGDVPRETRFVLAGKVFSHTAYYDALIADYLLKQMDDVYPETLTLAFEKQQALRYGENPHQSAAFYRDAFVTEGSVPQAEQLHGKELSYNNITDADAAVALVKEFVGPCAVAVKHQCPCGVGWGETIHEAWQNAYEADTVSVFGGVVALNRACDEALAGELIKIFLEIIIAPSFTDGALEVFASKKNLRLLSLEKVALPRAENALDFKKVLGGLMVQRADAALCGEVTCVTQKICTPEEQASLEMAWRVCKHVKSNGIVLVKGNRTVGIGPGQVNRVTALSLAIQYAGEDAKGAVMASDGFFPFPDCVELAGKAGITAIWQPGGSRNDQASIDTANTLGIAMAFTGMRHFKH